MKCLCAKIAIMELAWIISKDDEVEAVLMHPDLHVRPPGQPVPAGMAGTALGEIYARLVRMNEGERHDELRRLVLDTIAGWDRARIAELTREAAATMDARDVGGYVVAAMIGLNRPAQAIPLIRDFAAAIATGASDQAIARGVSATPQLLDLLPAHDDLDVRANLLGFLFQAYAAMATLVENRLHDRAAPPVVLTRRWAACDVEVCGAQLKRGDALAVLLTSPALNFGAGRHACPGEAIARAIAAAVAGPMSKVGAAVRRSDRTPP